MSGQEMDALKEYGRKLRSYSTAELEDIYYQIDIVKFPTQYKLVRMEMEQRRVSPRVSPIAVSPPDMAAWMEERPFLRNRPRLCGVAVAAAMAAFSGAVTLGIILPIWLCAVPLGFLGIESAVVYLFWLPVGPIMGVAVAARTGRRGAYVLASLAGAGAAVWLFNQTGVIDLIIRTALRQGGGAGGGISFGF